MSKMQSICRRCHRVRAVNSTRYCDPCDNTLAAMMRPRTRAQEEPEEEPTAPPPTDPDPTDPPPPPDADLDDHGPETPRDPSLQSAALEGGAQ